MGSIAMYSDCCVRQNAVLMQTRQDKDGCSSLAPGGGKMRDLWNEVACDAKLASPQNAAGAQDIIEKHALSFRVTFYFSIVRSFAVMFLCCGNRRKRGLW